MKNTLLNFSISAITVFILSFLGLLLFTYLCDSGIISLSLSTTIIVVFSYVMFFLFGFIFGLKEKKYRLSKTLLFAIVYLIIIYSYKSASHQQLDSIDHLIIILRAVTLPLGCVVAKILTH